MSNKAPVWFQSFYEEFTSFKNNQEQFNKEMVEFKNNQKQFNKEVISRLDNIEIRLTKIENCPTIKAESQRLN